MWPHTCLVISKTSAFVLLFSVTRVVNWACFDYTCIYIFYYIDARLFSSVALVQNPRPIFNYFGLTFRTTVACAYIITCLYYSLTHDMYFVSILLSIDTHMICKNMCTHRVVSGLIDIVDVLPMSTSWTPMLARAGSIPSCASMRLGGQLPADWLWFIKFSHH